MQSELVDQTTDQGPECKIHPSTGGASAASVCSTNAARHCGERSQPASRHTRIPFRSSSSPFSNLRYGELHTLRLVSTVGCFARAWFLLVSFSLVRFVRAQPPNAGVGWVGVLVVVLAGTHTGRPSQGIPISSGCVVVSSNNWRSPARPWVLLLRRCCRAWIPCSVH